MDGEEAKPVVIFMLGEGVGGRLWSTARESNPKSNLTVISYSYLKYQVIRVGN